MQNIKEIINMKKKLPKILVHLHLYYHDQVDYFITKLSNINSCEWDLYVTYVEENQTSFDKIKKLKPETKIVKVKNIGYDVYPFIQVIQSVNLDDYDYVLKLHTKNKRKEYIFPSYRKKGYWWRNELVDSLLKTKKRFKSNLNLLSNPKIGMVYSDIFMANHRLAFLPEDNSALENELEKINFQKDYKYQFCTGTMFFAKAKIFKFLQEREYNEYDFDCSMNTTGHGSLAHIYERILCIAVSEYGYNTITVNNRSVIRQLLSLEHNWFKDTIFLYLMGIRFKFPNKIEEGSYMPTLPELIFSIKNSEAGQRRHKVVNLCGLKIKIKSPK